MERQSGPNETKYTFDEWNDVLSVAASQFSKAHADATVLIYSCHATFTRVLDDPAAQGFTAGDGDKGGGSIWRDRSHPTSKMHDEMAKDLISFLTELPKTTSAETF